LTGAFTVSEVDTDVEYSRHCYRRNLKKVLRIGSAGAYRAQIDIIVDGGAREARLGGSGVATGHPTDRYPMTRTAATDTFDPTSAVERRLTRMKLKPATAIALVGCIILVAADSQSLSLLPLFGTIMVQYHLTSASSAPAQSPS